ncbi:MAG: PDZ domain-containing protein [Prosthecobacter sp.]|jgi:hypothetical protein|uniref:S1C family serine protease n=1 Tax=Prosthecobacter sp. TaxID=1965333 RepID=UPI0019D85FB1|nr:PDZ domain-containing protein [Prosthecobacter sp.]MBE2285663.1 PDZ domain-containing protein [Prosthecobacter sp.]
MKLKHSLLLACLTASPTWAQQVDEKKSEVRETQKSESSSADGHASGTATATANSNGVTKSETRGFDSRTGRNHRNQPNQPGRGGAQAPDQKPVAYIGVLTREVPPELRSQFSLPDSFGLMVEEVMPDSPAEKAGLKVHDLLLKFEDQQLVSMEQLMVLVRSKHKGDVVNLTVISGGKESQVPVTLGEKLTPVAQPQNAFAGIPDGAFHFNRPGGGFGGNLRGFQEQSREFNEQMQRFQKEMQQYQQRIQDWVRQNNQGPMPQPPMFNMPGQQPRRGGVNGGVNMQPVNPANGNVQQFNFSETHAATNITRRDDTGEYTLKREDGKTTFVARPNNAPEQSWPVNTDEERKALPEQFRDKLRMMDGPGSSIRIEVNPAPDKKAVPDGTRPPSSGPGQKPTTSA